jgi:antitoxin component HigA of HigAB toxin-antitoxin module
VSSILSGKKELTLKMVRGLHEFLGIPAEAFLTNTKKKVKLV